MKLTPRIVALVGVMPMLVGAAPALAGPTAGDHGRLDWFQGTFEEALVKAKQEQKLVFIDFWASWCGVCRQFDVAVLSDTAVVAETRDFVCVVLDAESPIGQPLASRYGVAGLPSLVFVEPDGSLRERLSGLRPAGQFIHELRRIRANQGTLGEIEKKIAANPDDVEARLEHVIRLRRMQDPRWEKELEAARERIESGRGFDPKNPDQRFAIARKLRMCGDDKGYQEQLAKIRELDPEGRSVPMRRLALNERIEAVNARFSRERVFDPSPIQTFLAEETSPLVLFEGNSILYGMTSSRAEEAHRRGQTDILIRLRGEALECGRRAWKHCPPDRVASFGREFAQGLLADLSLGEDDRAFAVMVAAKSADAAPGSADHLEILGSCLERVGRREEAIAAFRLSLGIEPARESARRRLAELER